MAPTKKPESQETRTPEEIEREIARTRASIDDTVGELGERLRPSQLVDDARSYVRETARRGASNAWSSVSTTARSNAVPLALIGGGVAWYMASRRGNGSRGYASGYDEGYRAASGYRGYEEYPSEWRESEQGLAGSVGSAVHGAREKAGELASRTAERAREATGHLYERGAEMGSNVQHQVGRQLDRARGQLQSLEAEQPLLLGMAALAVGALLGGGLPATRREDELLGEKRDQVLGAAAQAGRETVEQVRQAAGQLGEEAASAIRERTGATPQQDPSPSF
jgi:hypothetical protein